MSGICGIVNAEGAPVASDILDSLTESLAFRGPDASHVWSQGAAGLGHALLHTSIELPGVTQPFSLDGRVWITADARIDGQGELKRALEARGMRVRADASDAALLLHSYEAWGEDCVKHLLGDFAFAIWDAPRKRLFCARDHFGIKPFFYALAGSSFVFSNTFASIRRHPAISSDLDDLAIADFLLFEMSRDPSATGFAVIRRLPPAHCLILNRDGLKTRPYWSLPYGATVVHRRDSREYLEGFKDVLGAAVADRIRSNRVGVLMSGGLDSPAIAAVASSQLLASAQPFDLRAHTIVYDRLFPDDERLYSGLVAQRLRIPIHYHVADNYGLYQGFDQLKGRFPEPTHEPFAAIDLDLARDAARHARIILTGWDGDILLSESPRPYFRFLLRQRRLVTLVGSVCRYMISERKIVPAGLLTWRRKKSGARPFPPWLNPEFEERRRLRERMAKAAAEVPTAHPIRPSAFRALEFLMRTSRFFEVCDPGFTRCHVEYRHPLLDLRVLDYCLSLPPYPWCARKEILRQAMRGALPERVLARPKTPLAGYAHHELLKGEGSRWIDNFFVSPVMARYVNRDKMPLLRSEIDPQRTWMHLRPVSLGMWLRNVETPSVQSEETTNEFA